MRNAFVRSMLVAGLALAVTACDSLMEPRDHEFDGPSTVEFAPVLPSGSYTLSVELDAGSTQDETVDVGVNYIGPPPSSAVSGSVSVTGESSAVEGTHVTLSDQGGYTIASGENTTDVPVTIHGDALADGEAVTAVLELSADGDVEVAANYDSFTIEISKSGGS